MIDLTGLNALVTGCTGGIGSAITVALAHAGATVIATDLQEAPKVLASTDIGKAAAGNIRYSQLDVTDEARWATLMADITRDYGYLDILVHNAGLIILKPLEEMTLKDMRLLNSVNVEGVFLGTKAALPLLREGGTRRESGASMITISSVAAMIGAPLQVCYATTKSAVRMFSKACAMEFSASGFNIRSNSVHPGSVDTAMVDLIAQRKAEYGAATTAQEAKQRLADAHPIGRIATPEDIAKVVRFLASDEAGYMHGTEVVVDGGVTAR